MKVFLAGLWGIVLCAKLAMNNDQCSSDDEEKPQPSRADSCRWKEACVTAARMHLMVQSHGNHRGIPSFAKDMPLPLAGSILHEPPSPFSLLP